MGQPHKNHIVVIFQGPSYEGQNLIKAPYLHQASKPVVGGYAKEKKSLTWQHWLTPVEFPIKPQMKLQHQN